MKNKVKTKRETAAKASRKSGFARSVNALLSGSFLTKAYVQRNMPFLFFLVLIMVSYIAYGYYAENNAKQLVKAEQKLNELKARNLSVNARLEQLKQQSAVAEAISDLGLKESTTPPYIIRSSANTAPGEEP